MVDPGAEADDQLQIRQRGEEPRLGLPHQGILDRRPVADLGRVADLVLRHQRPEQWPPPRRRGRARAEEDGHYPNSFIAAALAELSASNSSAASRICATGTAPRHG